MAKIDKIEFKAASLIGLKLYAGSKVYVSAIIDNQPLNGKVSFSLDEITTEATVTATSRWINNGYWYCVNVINPVVDNNGWMQNDLGTEPLSDSKLTITFDNPIEVTKLEVVGQGAHTNKSNWVEGTVYSYGHIIAQQRVDGLGATLVIDQINTYTYFVKSQNSYYTIANGQLTQVVTPTAGGIEDISLITPTLIQNLVEPKIVVVQEGATPETEISIQATVLLQPQTIKQITDIDVTTAEEISNIIVTHTGTAVVKVSCSIDGGMSWLKYDTQLGLWTPTELSGGNTIDEIQGLTAEQASYLVRDNQLRFAFYIEQQSIEDNIEITNIKFSLKKEGLWTSCILNTDYIYGRGTDFIEFTAKKAGDYLINYTE